MKTLLRTDFLKLLDQRLAEHRLDGTTWLLQPGEAPVQVEVVGYDLDCQLYGNNAENAQIKLERVRSLIVDGRTAGQAIERVHPDAWRPGSVALTPDGNDGTFKVHLKHRTRNGGWITTIDAPLIPGWHGKSWFAFDHQLSPA